jgi:glycolate oxidase iron-sulfur subunit
MRGRRVILLEGCVQAAATPNTNQAARPAPRSPGHRRRGQAGAGLLRRTEHAPWRYGDGRDDMRRNIDAWWPAIEAVPRP